MNTSSITMIPVAWLAFVCPLSAQLPNPPSREVKPSSNNSGVVPDGIVFYRGQTYLIRNGRAALIDETLVPDGQLLSLNGRLVPVPAPYLVANAKHLPVEDGILQYGGHSYLIRKGIATPINAALVPDGQVLDEAGRLQPLPSDFSGFNLERSPAGTSLPQPVSTASGQQALPNQAGVESQSSGFVGSSTKIGTASNTPTANKTSHSAASQVNGSAAGQNSVSGGGAILQAGEQPKPDTTAARSTNRATRAEGGAPARSTADKSVRGASGSTKTISAGGEPATTAGGAAPAGTSSGGGK